MATGTATGTARSAEQHGATPSSLMQQPQTHLENIVVSDHARAHFGNNYSGPISYTTTIHEAASNTTVEQPRLLPRAANRQYFGYTDVLEQLKNCFLRQDNADHSRGQTVCVLQGMGGVGKSETVLQFLDKNDRALRERFWGIFWVDCESETSARADFARVGGICGWSLDGGDALSSFKDQLASSKKTSLLILDNCDDTETDYNRYIPHGSQVSVLLTTRLTDARIYASVDPEDSKSKFFLQMNGLDASSAIDLLLEASGIQERDQQSFDHAKQIVTALDHHPLAITVASSLVRSSVYSLQEYVDALQKRLAHKELLDTNSMQARYRKVSTTFEVSAEALQSSASTDQSAKAALALLDVLGFMHHQNVSEEIFIRAWEYEETVLSKYGSDNGEDDGCITHLSSWHVTRCRSIFSALPPRERTQLLRKARAHLRQLSLLSVDCTKCVSLHLIVHAWARARVKCPSETWTGVASMLALSAQGLTGWQPYIPQLVPHYETNFGIWRDMDSSNRNDWEVCRIWSVYAYKTYRALSIATLEICLQLHGQTERLSYDHPDRPAHAQATYVLGLAYGMNGQRIEAIKALEHAVELNEQRADDQDRQLLSQQELAKAYRANGQVTEAINILEQIVKIRAEKLVGDQSDLLRSQYELASTYKSNRQITKAIELFEYVVKADVGEIAENDPEQLGGQLSLAQAYLADGQVTRAISILEHVAKIRGEKLAKRHPSWLSSQHQLAGAYLANREVTRAIHMLEHVVKVKQEILAEDHPNQLASQHELARAYLADRQITKAIDTLEQIVKIEEKLAEDDPSRLASQELLAHAYLEDGQPEQITKAIDMVEHVGKIREETLAEDHPDRLTSQQLLARAYLEREEITREQGNQVVSQRDLPRVYLANKRITKAINMLEYVVKVREDTLTEDHYDRLVAQELLGCAYLDDGQFTRAIELFKLVVAISQRKYDENHYDRTRPQRWLAKAIRLQEKARLESQQTSAPDEPDQETPPSDHPTTEDAPASIWREEDKYQWECDPISVAIGPDSSSKQSRRDKLELIFQPWQRRKGED